MSAAGLFFFWSNTLSAFSYPVAAWIAKRVGLVNTMVFTHIPSSIFLILAAFSPNLYLALGLLLLRSALSQMDVPTRTSYVMAVVTPAERPAAASVTAVPRSLASAISPAISGALLMTSFTGLPLVVCGTLKIAYDLACCSRSAISSRPGAGALDLLARDYQGVRRPSGRGSITRRSSRTCDHCASLISGESGRVGLFRVKGQFLVCLHLVFGGLREPVPFLVRLAQRALTALGFQFT